MGRVELTRARLALAVALVSAAGSVAIVWAASASAGGAAPLAPDLVTLVHQDDDLLITVEKRRTMLRLSNEVSNRGDGPLEVFPSSASNNCDEDDDPVNDRDASQRLFADTNASGSFERGLDGVASELPVGCMRYHPAHDHWHVLDFARYELRREPRGKLAAVTRKVGFCLGDNRILTLGAPATPLGPVYPYGPPGSVGCDAAATQGLSVGWADIYPYYVPGQQIDVTELPSGRYCLVSRADPNDHLAELNEDNNLRRTRIELRPKRLAVSKLPGRCRI